MGDDAIAASAILVVTSVGRHAGIWMGSTSTAAIDSVVAVVAVVVMMFGNRVSR